jgi:succinate dehydrogenase/fumarate reductase flavoprotein subunit
MEKQHGGAVGELCNMLLVGQLLTAAALRRTESRGVHYRSDYPEQSPRWDKHIFAENQVPGGLGLS